MSIDLEFVELTADVLNFFIKNSSVTAIQAAVGPKQDGVNKAASRYNI